jgi:ribosomal protein L37AE/L43A
MSKRGVKQLHPGHEEQMTCLVCERTTTHVLTQEHRWRCTECRKDER